MIYSETITRVMQHAEDATLTLLTLAAEVRDENQVYIRITHLMRLRGVSRATVERHLKKLRELGILVPDPSEEGIQRGIHRWRIAPHIVWVGKAHDKLLYLQGLNADHPFHYWAPGGDVAMPTFDSPSSTSEPEIL